MSGNVQPRNPIPFIVKLRNILRGRVVVDAIRFPNEVAPRTQPPPNVPYGPYHKTSKVYYYTRDARRLVQPAVEIYSSTKKLEAEKDTASEQKLIQTPGKIYNPPKH